MDNASASENTPRVSPPATEEIPVALRESSEIVSQPRFSKPLLIGGLVSIGFLALLAGVWFAFTWQRDNQTSLTGANATGNSEAAVTPAPSKPDDSLLGHYAYSEAPLSELEPLVADGSIRLRKAAARAFKAMVADAQAAGIALVPISGFRSLGDQRYLYFDVKAERGQTAPERAKVSAPPGYSEHHTGYAIDVGDGNVPATNLRADFDGTPAYRWLQENAPRYSFELSFPKGNRQGVSYEPWHWRYVGDIQSLKTFYKAREQQPTPAN